jgi:uncharacterized protein (TIGR00725 family)
MTPPPQAPYIAVIGTGGSDDDLGALAEQVGIELAERGCILFCGGLGGVMEAACRGAKSAGGKTVAILPGARRSDANDFVDIAISTGMGEMRNALLVRAVDAVIAVGGGFGTLSEIAFALKTGTPVIGIGTWTLADDSGPIDAFSRASSAAEAVDKALSSLPNTPSG